MHIQLVTQDKKQYLHLLLLADEQEDMIDRYLEKGALYVLFNEETPMGLCLVTEEDGGLFEIKNMAIDPAWQNKGYGKKLIAHVEQSLGGKARTLVVGTGDSPLTIPFYENCGFIYSHRIKNFFVDHYHHPIYECGRQLRDLVYLKKNLKPKKEEDR